MSYYQGDYYQGDYYQGDPFLGSLIGMGATWLGKKLLGRGAPKALVASTGAGTMVGAGTGLVAGAVGGALAQQGAGALWSRLSGVTRNFGMGSGSQYQPPTMPPAARQPINLTMSGSSGALCCPSGFHPNKSTGMGRATMGMPPGSFCTRNRAMNVANPRALRRGLRRVAGFGKLASRAKKTINATARAMK